MGARGGSIDLEYARRFKGFAETLERCENALKLHFDHLLMTDGDIGGKRAESRLAQPRALHGDNRMQYLN